MEAIYASLSEHLSDRLATPPEPDTLKRLYTQQWCHLSEIISLAAQTGDSNSVLLIGPRGVGKSALLECVLSELGHGRDRSPADTDNCVVVRLHGLVQTDDRLAIQQITQQLNLTTAVGTRTFSSFSDNLSFLLTALRSGDRVAVKTVVFVLEEFDLFCEHKNQTLLYNLFDVAQSAQTPVCVIGVTPRLDVVELLEKRVKSRFSHRQLCVHGATCIEHYTAIALSYLTLQPTRTPPGGERWNQHVAELFSLPGVLACLRQLFHHSRDIRQLKTYLRLVLVECLISLSSDDNCDASTALSLSHFQCVSDKMAVDPRHKMLLGLSVLELCLVISMRHLSQIYDETFNFEMVCREFGKFAAKNSTFASFPRAVLMKAFENLQTLELVRSADSATSQSVSRGLKEFQLFSLTVTRQELEDAVKQMEAVPTEVTQWATTAVL